MKHVVIEKYIASIPKRVIRKFCQFHKRIDKLSKNKAGKKNSQSASCDNVISILSNIISVVIFMKKQELGTFRFYIDGIN